MKKKTPGPITFQGETYYPVRIAAELLGWSLEYTYAAIKSGKVRASKVNIKRISGSEIRRLLDGDPAKPSDLESKEARRKRDAPINKEMEAAGW